MSANLYIIHFYLFLGWFWSGSGARITPTNSTPPGWPRSPWSHTGYIGQFLSMYSCNSKMFISCYLLILFNAKRLIALSINLINAWICCLHTYQQHLV